MAGSASPKRVGGQRSPSSHRFWHGHQGREDRNERRSSRFGHRRAVDGKQFGTRSGDRLWAPSPKTKTALGAVPWRGGLTRKGLTCVSPSLHEHTRVTSVKTLRFALLHEQSPQVEPVTPADPPMIDCHVCAPLCLCRGGALMGHPTRFIAAGGEELCLRDAFDTVVVIDVL